MTVLCLVERDGDGAADVSLRALTFAGPWPGPGRAALAAAVFGPGVPAELSTYGVADVYAVEAGDGYAPQAWGRALAGLAAELNAAAVVAAGTDRGSEVLAHLAAITGLPMAANCVSAALTAGRHVPARPAPLGGQPARGQRARRVARAAHRGGRRGSCGPGRCPGPGHRARFRPPLDEADLRVSATESAERSAGVSLATARVVVGGGRGVGGPDGFAPIEELAGLLGAAVGVSRVVTSEGWRPHKQQVGQTGTRISPELYLACGISGAIQHMAGCMSAKHIVAVNTDPDAPIISRADYAVIGDLNEVIPALITAIRARS